MNGNILTQTSWKVKAVFTLTVLFASTFLLITNLPAGYFVGDNSDLKAGWAFDEWSTEAKKVRVWCESYVTTWYDTPYAKSCHNAYISNDSGIPLRYYYTFKAEVTADDADDDAEIAPKEVEGHGFVANGDSWSTCKSFSFNMDVLGEDREWYKITGWSDLTVKGDFTQNGNFQDQGEISEWNAKCSTGFRYVKEE